MKLVLLATGLYDIAWAIWIVLSPRQTWELADIHVPLRLQDWQFSGALLGVVGVALMLAAARPLRRWRIVMFGLASKVAGVASFVTLAFLGLAPWTLWWCVTVNDLVWCPPLGIIAAAGLRRHYTELDAPSTPDR